MKHVITTEMECLVSTDNTDILHEKTTFYVFYNENILKLSHGKKNHVVIKIN